MVCENFNCVIMLMMLFKTTAVILGCCSILYLVLWLCHRLALRHYKKVPGPKPIMVLGNISKFGRMYSRKMMHHPGVYVLQAISGTCHLFRKEGFFIVWMSYFPILSVFKAELIELILSSSTSLEKSFEYSYLHQWLGCGLLTSTGSKWRSRRKLLTPSFHFRILDDFLPTFNEQSLVLVRKLRELKDADHVDIMPLVVLCTLDMVCETVMGVSIGAQTGENPKYVQAVHNLGDALIERVTRPLLWPDFLFKMSGAGQAWNRDLKTLHSFTEKVIREKKASLLSKGGKMSESEDELRLGGKKRQALMDLLLDMHVNGQQIMEEDIREEVDTFMFEGHDTTAMGITFALYCIGLHPQVQRKVQEELDAIFDGDARRHVTIDDVRNMKYLECVLKESQRLYPSVPFIGRVLNEDLKMSNVVLPKGTTIHCHIQSLHRDPEWFPNPEAFDPDRFLPENLLDRHPFAYIPFSAGPRNCIGQKFALLEEKVVISNILRNFTAVSLDPRDKVLLKMEFVLRPAQPIRMKFIPR
ncbi:unnamed protein product [Larinioides sclopetarius]|uniref:Cytochrome P450 n=1 Tax=Larinioides sclopetarius TaxID=280406 RepID=A0AAV2BKC1_9ARAC